MSFVQKLRMNNIFPTGGMNLGFTGELPQYGGVDPLQEIFDLSDERNNQNQGRLRQIANQNIGRPDDNNTPMKFGGMFGRDSNPGADILRRAANTEGLGERPSNPQLTIPQAKAIKEKQFPGFAMAVEGLDIDKQLDREAKRTNIDATKQRIEQGNRRLTIAEHKAANPNLKFIPIKGGNIMSFNPVTGDSEDTGIATNTLTEAERLRIIQENAMTKQNDAQAAALDKPNQPSQVKHQLDNRILEAINRNPAWRDYIDMETGVVAPVGTGASMWGSNKGLDETTRTAILNAIYGSQTPTPSNPNTPNSTPVTPTPQSTTPVNQPITSERIRIQMPDGTKGMWIASKPLPQGAIRIQ